jgi:hypothetical protein
LGETLKELGRRRRGNKLGLGEEGYQVTWPPHTTFGASVSCGHAVNRRMGLFLIHLHRRRRRDPDDDKREGNCKGQNAARKRGRNGSRDRGRHFICSSELGSVAGADDDSDFTTTVDLLLTLEGVLWRKVPQQKLKQRVSYRNRNRDPLSIAPIQQKSCLSRDILRGNLRSLLHLSQEEKWKCPQRGREKDRREGE